MCVSFVLVLLAALVLLLIVAARKYRSQQCSAGIVDQHELLGLLVLNGLLYRGTARHLSLNTESGPSRSLEI